MALVTPVTEHWLEWEIVSGSTRTENQMDLKTYHRSYVLLICARNKTDSKYTLLNEDSGYLNAAHSNT